MDTESLLSGSKWNVIELIAKEELSPLQIAEKIGTSVANISQQLKLLELVGVVTSRKIPNREKGKPRTLYTLSADYVYIIVMLRGFAAKRLIKATSIHSAISRIFSIQQQDLHYPLLKLFWTLEPFLEDISAIAYDFASSTAFVVGNSKIKLKPSYSFTHKNQSFTIKAKLVSKLPSVENLILIYAGNKEEVIQE